ncbi:MAG: DEAD/DEAH box helicase, partial [archaeon]|nr:DEAD/DEAH box helicase [archaeon]
MFKSDAEIDCYHDLISAEYMNLEGNAFIFENKNSRLNNAQTLNTCSKYGVNQKDLQNDGLLIEYPDGTFRTMHIDLIYRAINAKAASWSPKIPLEFKLVKPKEEAIPSFSEHKIEELDPLLNLDGKTKDILIGALRDSEYVGLAYHQLHYLNEIIRKEHKCHLLVSPTASGKSLIFYIAVLVSILSKTEVKGTRAIILYPRKALASDQLMKFLKVIYALNQRLSKEGMSVINVGIDDGDTPRSSSSEEVKKGEVFRGIKCIEKGCNGNLRYRLIKSSCRVVCEKCNKNYDEIVATKGDIWSSQPSIVFSNLSALNRRLMIKDAQSIVGPSVEWIVLDEAHVYREETGGHARWLLRRILARFNVLMKGNAKFIVSSATIYNPVGFVKKLLGLPAGVYF